MPNHVPQKELVERLKTIKEVLQENETAATPDLVEAIDLVLKLMKPSNKLMEDICRHQMKNCNRKVSPNISITEVNGNFKYPFGL